MILIILVGTMFVLCTTSMIASRLIDLLLLLCNKSIDKTGSLIILCTKGLAIYLFRLFWQKRLRTIDYKVDLLGKSKLKRIEGHRRNPVTIDQV